MVRVITGSPGAKRARAPVSRRGRGPRPWLLLPGHSSPSRRHGACGNERATLERLSRPGRGNGPHEEADPAREGALRAGRRRLPGDADVANPRPEVEAW